MLSHLVCCSSSFSLSPRVQYARSALLDENYLLLLLSSSLAGLLQTLFWSVGVCLLKMACFHIRNTYATSQVSIVLDMYIYWWDGIFLSWHHSKGKKKKKIITWKDLKLYWEERNESFLCTLLQKYRPLGTKVSRALLERLEVSLPPNGKLLGCTHFWHPRDPPFFLPRESDM